MPDPVNTAPTPGPATPPAAASDPVSTPAPAPPPVPPPPAPHPAASQSSGSGPGSSGVSGGPAGLTSPPAPALPAASGEDRVRALEAQLAQYKQYEHLIPLGMRAYQQAAQPAQPVPPAAAPKANVFGLPDFDQRLLDFVERDPATGRLVLVPGAPPDAAIRVQEYQQKLRDAQFQFFQNPEKFLGPLIEAKAKEIASGQFDERHTQVRAVETANRIIQENAGWLYAKDAQGQAVAQFNPATGRHEPVLSAAGRYYQSFIDRAVAMGLKTPEDRHEFAWTMLQNLALQQQAKDAGASAAGQQAKQGFLDAAAAHPPAQPPVAPALPAQPAPSAVTLRERMHANMNAAGLTDQVLQNQLGRPAAAA